MSVEARSDAGNDPRPTPPVRPTISACESCPERTVFLESGNTDGWIATDLTVELAR